MSSDMKMCVKMPSITVKHVSPQNSNTCVRQVMLPAAISASKLVLFRTLHWATELDMLKESATKNSIESVMVAMRKKLTTRLGTPLHTACP